MLLETPQYFLLSSIAKGGKASKESKGGNVRVNCTKKLYDQYFATTVQSECGHSDLF